MATSTLGNGTLVLAGTTSGTTTVTATAVAGTTTLTLPAATDTLVGKATTDTLTNKTLTGAAMNGTLGATTPSTASVTTLTTSSTVTHNGGTANGVPYLNGSKVLTTGSDLVFDGSQLSVLRSSTSTALFDDAEIRAINTGAATLNQRIDIAMRWQDGTYNGTGGISMIRESATARSGALSFCPIDSSGNALSAMRLDSSGNLGLGVTPSTWNSTIKAAQFALGGSIAGATNTSNIALNSNAYLNSAGSAYVYINSDYATRYLQQGGVHYWYNAASGTAGNAITFTQAMTLDSSGNLLVGTTNSSDTNSAGFRAQPSGVATSTLTASGTGDSTMRVYSTGAGAYRFYVRMDGTVFATTTTISGISDIRYKENVRDLDAGLDKIMALKPRLYDWKEGKGANIKNARGFIAQEFEQVFPDLIDKWKDPSPEGEEPYKSIRADLIPVLVKAIQEQQALITTLTARITALESA